MGALIPRPPLPRSATSEEMLADLARVRGEIRSASFVNACLALVALATMAALIGHALLK